MLKNRYQEILVGMGPMSLIRGIISLKRNRSTLLIDDTRFSTESYPGLYLSELEILAFLRLGKKYEVPELLEIRKFLQPANIELVAEVRQTRLGNSPLLNLKELLRKFPELLDHSDLDLVYEEKEEEFSRYFMEELARFEELSFDSSVRSKANNFDLQGPKWFKVIYQRFGELINEEYEKSKSLKFKGLLHLLGLSFEDKIKTKLGVEEIPFYFFRMLSPVYRLQDFFLTTQLKRRLVLLGGDYKKSTVQFWQMHEGQFENLLLESFEGVISGERVLFFSHLPEDVPFGLHSPFSLFRKAKIQEIKRNTTPYPPTTLSFMTDLSHLGSERPYRVMARGTDFDFYHWPYPELPGSKSEFYEKSITESFQEDTGLVPVDSVQTEFSPEGSMSLDLRSLIPEGRGARPVLERLPIGIHEGENPIKGFEYWGAFRYRAFGALALCYGIEGI